MKTKVELSDEVLKQVSGGFSEQNGHYSLSEGGYFCEGIYRLQAGVGN